MFRPGSIRIVWYGVLLGQLFASVPALAQVNFEEKFRRDYNVFQDTKQYRPAMPPNPLDALDAKNPNNIVSPLDSIAPSNAADAYKPDPNLRMNNPLNPKAPRTGQQSPGRTP
ncbi:hypothetical protein W02_36490 [Nitrospira sp. KM1]|nr:hypothetical protein W02_36490 [Nitrospira sp. KM1]